MVALWQGNPVICKVAGWPAVIDESLLAWAEEALVLLCM
jgi:hypothetical protein